MRRRVVEEHRLLEQPVHRDELGEAEPLEDLARLQPVGLEPRIGQGAGDVPMSHQDPGVELVLPTHWIVRAQTGIRRIRVLVETGPVEAR